MAKKPASKAKLKLPPGIYLREGRDGSLRYQAKFRSNKAGNKVVETDTFDVLDDAVLWLAERKAKFKQDGGESLKKLNTSQAKTKLQTPFRDVIDQYVREVTMLKEDPHRDVNLFNKLKQEAWTSWPISAITTDEINSYIERRTKEGKKSSTINNVINKISKVYRQAATKKWGYIGLVNPTRGDDVQRPAPPVPRYRSMTDEEAGRLFEECEKGPVYLIWFVKIAILTSLRSGEIRKLNWRHYHEVDTALTSGAYWHLPKTKNGKTRDVPLTIEAQGIVIAMKKALPERADGFVFGDPKKKAKDGGISEDMITNAYRDAAERAGFIDHEAIAEKQSRGKKPGFISSKTFHDLRHVSITQLSNFYDDEMKLAATTGHSDPKTLSIYFNPSGAKKVELLHLGENRHVADIEAFKAKLAEDKKKAELKAAEEHAARELAEQQLAEQKRQQEEREKEMKAALDAALEAKRFYRLEHLEKLPASPERDAEISKLKAETAEYHRQYPDAEKSEDLEFDDRLQALEDDQSARHDFVAQQEQLADEERREAEIRRLRGED